MSFCTKCGTKIDVDSSFCAECGTPVNRGMSESSVQTSAPRQRTTETESDLPKSDPPVGLQRATSPVSPINNEGVYQIKRALGNAPVFVVAYIIFMLPTYFLPYVGSNSFVLQGLSAAVKGELVILFLLHLGSMLILCFLCWVRGEYVNKKGLLILPVLAIVFDFVPGLSLIPMIPTMMHLLAMILGVVGAQRALPPGTPA